MINILGAISSALSRCRVVILTVFVTYCLSCLVGIIMVHYGNNFALSYRDKTVSKAVTTDKASIDYQKGNNFSAALHDFKGNLFFGALPQTLMGLSIIGPYFSISKQGWIGGIVSVNSKHETRFRNIKSTSYYFIVLLLQFIPYSLAIGAGIRFGIDFFNNNNIHGWLIWKYRIPKGNLTDLGYIYIIVVPLFFIASCFEFISTWNG